MISLEGGQEPEGPAGGAEGPEGRGGGGGGGHEPEGRAQGPEGRCGGHEGQTKFGVFFMKFHWVLSVKTHEESVSDLLCLAHALRKKIIQPQLRTVRLLLKKEQIFLKNKNVLRDPAAGWFVGRKKRREKTKQKNIAIRSP